MQMRRSRRRPIPTEAVVVSEASLGDDDPESLICSNVDFVNSLLDEYLTDDEISPDALRSYYVDYYLAQVNNGGFSQFVYNSRWNPKMVRLVREGLQAMQATRHLALFDEGAQLVERLGHEGVDAFLESEYFGDNSDRDALNGLNDRFNELDEEEEDLQVLNASWLRRLPNLVVLSDEAMDDEVERRAQAVPDRESRIAAAEEDEPRFVELIRGLCDEAGQELVNVTIGDPTRVHEGVRTMAWHFITNEGHHHMVEVGGKAIMFRGDSTTDQVCEIEAPEE